MGNIINYVDILDKWLERYKHKSKPPAKLHKLYEWFEWEEDELYKKLIKTKNKSKKKKGCD